MRTPPPFSADRGGSLLRRSGLLAARDDYAAGQISAAQLRAAEDAAVADVVAMQDELGLQSATDGEFRRASCHMDFIYQLGGVNNAPGNLAVKVPETSGTIEVTPAALHLGRQLRPHPTDFSQDFP